MVPQDFLQRMEQQLGTQYPQFLESLERPRAVALRFNPLKGDPTKLPFVQENVPWEPMGFYYDPDSRPGLHPYHEAGVYYLQEASAMAPVTLLDPQPGERVCDLCGIVTYRQFLGNGDSRSIELSGNTYRISVDDLADKDLVTYGYYRCFNHRYDIFEGSLSESGVSAEISCSFSCNM